LIAYWIETERLSFVKIGNCIEVRDEQGARFFNVRTPESLLLP